MQFPTDGNIDWGGQPLVPINTDTWPFEGTGLQDGVPVKGELVGYEIDSFDPSYPAPDAVVADAAGELAVHELPGRDDYTHNTSIYCAHSGALVFATGHDGLGVGRWHPAAAATAPRTTSGTRCKRLTVERPEQDARHLGRVRGRRPGVGGIHLDRCRCSGSRGDGGRRGYPRSATPRNGSLCDTREEDMSAVYTKWQRGYRVLLRALLASAF